MQPIENQSALPTGQMWRRDRRTLRQLYLSFCYRSRYRAIMSLILSGVVGMDMLIIIIISAAYRYFIVAFGLARTGHNLDVGEFFETRTLYFDAETTGEGIMVCVSMVIFVLH